MNVAFLCLFLFGITLLKEVAVCQPYITGPTPVICPDSNETFVFTCRDSQVFSITWSVSPGYDIFSDKDKMQFFVIDGRDLVIAEKPHPTTTWLNAGPVMFKSSYSSLQLIQFFATLFNGTAIDYYNISFSGGEETYSIVNTSENLSIPTWLQNVTKLNVTAHNCAGPSDPVTVYIPHAGCDQPLPPMNGSVDNVTTELGGRITFRCNDGFLPSEVMTAVCQTTGWSQDPLLLECFPQEFNSSRRISHIAIGAVVVSVVVGTAGVFIITFVVVASICIYVGTAKRKCCKHLTTNQNSRHVLGVDGRLDVQPDDSSSVPTYFHNELRDRIDLTNNPAYEVCQQRTHLSHMKNLSAQEPEYNMDNNPLYMMATK